MSGKNFNKVITSLPVIKLIQKELSKMTDTKIWENEVLEMIETMIISKNEGK